jgi:RimJ/RimL family protein N-acetyltransferase/predicted ATP-grasp superfamily ATP-dependent carboligase
LKHQKVTLGQFTLKVIQDKDIEDIRIWRNSQIDVLRQSAPISTEQQKKYFDQKIWPTMVQEDPESILLTFFEEGRRIGYGGLVHIAWEHRRAEVSFLVDTLIAADVPKRQYCFSNYLKMIRRLAFDDLGLNRLTTETYDIRPDYVEALEENGFVFEGRLHQHVMIDGEYVDSLCHAAFRQEGSKPAPNSNSGLRVLVSSSGAKAPLISVIKDVSQRMPVALSVIAGDANPSALSKYVADEFIHLPSTDQYNLEKIGSLCKERNIDLIIPTRDGELDFWSRNRQFFEDHGTAVLVSEPEAIAISVDKLAFAYFGESNNLPILAAWENPVGGGPFVVKERYGAGSRSIGLNLQKNAALAHGATLACPIYQPFIEGREISVDAWIDRQHKVKGLVLRERNEVASGESVVTTTFRNPGLESECVKILEALPLRGPVVLQLIIDADGCPHIIELNARFGGASTASIAAGLDIWYWTLLELKGQDLELVPFKRSDVEVRQIRVPRDIVLYDFDI